MTTARPTTGPSPRHAPPSALRGFAAAREAGEALPIEQAVAKALAVSIIG
jgi:hypothetical protein